MRWTVPIRARIAWDGARVIVRAAADEAWAVWFANWINAHAGDPWGRLVMQCRTRLVAAYGYEAAAAESGVWRVRLADLLEARPDLVQPLADVIRETNERLRSVA